MKILTVSPLCEADNPKVVEAYLNGMLSQTLCSKMFLVFAINECKLKVQSNFYLSMNSWATYHQRHFAHCEARYFDNPYYAPVSNPNNVNTIYRKTVQKMMIKKRSLSHLWMVSGDNIVSPRGLEMLIEDDKDAVGLPVFHRFATMPYTNIQEWSPSKISRPYVLYDEMPKNQVVEVDGLSAACILLKRHVVEKIDFGFTWMDLDFSMCKSIREQGFKIYADTREIVGHAEPNGTIINYEYWRKIKGWSSEGPLRFG